MHLQCRAEVHYNFLWANRLYSGPSSRVMEDQAVTAPDQYGEMKAGQAPDMDVEVAFNEPEYQLPPLGCAGRHNSCLPCRTSVQVGGQHFCALGDTGAQVSLVSEAVLEQLVASQVEVAPATLVVRIRTLGGSVSSGRQVTLAVILPDCQAVDLLLLVVPDECMPFCFNNVVDSLPLVIDYSQQCFHLGSSTCIPFLPGGCKVEHYELCLVQL